MKQPTKISRVQTIGNEEARLAATPFGCGQCLPCRINKSREWCHRILLEQAISEFSCFVTLTYSDENIPKDQNLEKSTLQKYIKRVRRTLDPIKIRYFAVGEYGNKTWRPHYHVAFFGIDNLFAGVINKCWSINGTPIGFIHVGELNKNSARYITGYIMKKMTKEGDPYLKNRKPEFMLASKQEGGIGIGAIKVIAKKLKESKFYDKHVVRELSHGKRKMHLGRYLTRKLAELCEIPESEFLMDFWKYQEEIFVKHMEREGLYYDNIKDAEEANRISQEKRERIKNQRRLI